MLTGCCSPAQLTASESLVAQAQAASEATGGTLAPYGALALAALQGDECTVSALVDAAAPEVTERGEGAGMTAVGMANARAVPRPRPLPGSM